MRKTLKLSTIIISVLSIIGYLYVRNLWKEIISKEEYRAIVFDIKSTPKLPDKFYYYYEKLYPNSLTYSSKKLTFYSLIKRKHYRSPNMEVAFFFNIRDNRRRKLLRHSLSWKLERTGITQKECLNYLVFKKWDFLYNNKGIEKASKFYFDKELTELNNSEIATLVMMTKNPSLYNPKRNSSKNSRLNKALNVLLNN